MDTLQRLLAWYLGLNAPKPGEGTAWRFDGRLPDPHWLVLVISIVVVAFVLGIYRRDAQSVVWRHRIVLIGCRLTVFLLLLGMLTELSLTIERTGLPIVAVLVDVSASMSLQDQYPASSKAAKVAEELSKSSSGKNNRLAIAQQILTRKNGQFLHELMDRHQLRLYQFSDTATPLDAGDLGDSAKLQTAPESTKDTIDLALKELNELRAEGEQTKPAVAVRKVLGDLRGALPAAVVLFTDGIASVSDADKLSTVAEAARRKGIQFHIVGLGSDAAAKDLFLYDTLVDEVAFVSDPILFKAKLRSFGYVGKKIALQLRKEGEHSVLAQQDITIPADGQTVTVELSYTANTPGEFDYVLEIAEQRDETNRTNNAETRHVSVREEKIRVLLADGPPRYEFRFLKQLLERDKSIELSTVLQDADREYTEEDRTAIEVVPTQRQDLIRYDVLILGDLSTEELEAATQVNIRDFVREKGGSVVMIAGPRFNPLSWVGTPLESLLPFELAGVKKPADESSDSFHPVLTLEGQKGNSLFRLGNSEAESLKIWNGLPAQTWLVEIPKIKAGARVFAEHPLKNGTVGRLPVILMQQVGAGKVLYHATDETWRWRFRTGDLYHGRYWVQAIRYLSRGRLIGKDRTAELTIDQQVYQRGQPVTVRVKFVDEKYIPADTEGVVVTVERKGAGRQAVKLTRLRDLPTAFEGQLNRLAEGTYHCWVSQPAFKEAPPSVDFRIEIPQQEMLRRAMDKADLQLAATTTNGRLYSIDEVDRLPSEIPRGTPVPLETDEPIPLWNRWELLTLVIGFLTAEWLLRKHWKLI